MKKFLLVLVLSVAFIGSANANSIKGAFGYKLGNIVSNAKVIIDKRGNIYSVTNFSPRNPIPGLNEYWFKTSVISKKIFQIHAFNGYESYTNPPGLGNCNSLIPVMNDYNKLLNMLEAKYGDFKKTRRQVSFDPYYHYETYEFKDGNRKITLRCDERSKSYGLSLNYMDLKLSKKADEEEQEIKRKRLNEESGDYDI